MKKALCLSLAVAMTAQSSAFAQTDRVAGVTDIAIAQAQQNVTALRSQLLNLDSALLATAEQINKRDHSGGITNGVAIAGAAIGVGLTALGLTALGRGGSEGAGLTGIIILVGSAAASLGSVVSGTASSALKKDIETGKIDNDLAELEKQIAVVSNEQDKQTSALLQQLLTSVSGMRKSLKSYQSDEDFNDNLKLGSQIAQGVGAALMVYGLTNRNGMKVVSLALVLTNSAAIARIIAGMSDSQAEEVLKEIKATRLALQTSASALE